MIVVWSNPSCGPCAALEAALRSKGIRYTLKAVQDATEADRARWEALIGAAPKSSPVVEHHGGAFSGFDPAKVRSLLDARR